MSLETLIWGLCGYIAFHIFQLVKPLRNRSGWDFVAQVLVFGVAVFFLTKVLNWLLSSILPYELTFGFASWWYGIFPDSSLQFLVAICFAAPLVGCMAAKCWVSFAPSLETFRNWLSRDEVVHDNDLFYWTCYQLLNELVFLTLKNGKVYIGTLTTATRDPNESQKFIIITPVQSGYRRKEDHRLVLTTNYAFLEGEAPDSAPHQAPDVLIPATEILTLTAWDPVMHDRFLNLGLTIFEPRKEP